MLDDKIEKVGKVVGDEDLELSQVLENAKEPETATPDRERFNALLEEEKTVVKQAPLEKASLMDTVRDMSYAHSSLAPGHLSTEALIAQTEQVLSKIETVKQALETTDATIKSPAHTKLLENKLSHIDESLKIALSKAGVENVPAMEANEGSRVPGDIGSVNPVARFLGYVTDGQWQLENLYGQLNQMSKNGKQLSPVDMLAVQIKVGQIGQELQLFYSLLSKALESVKTIMNIQV